MLVVEVLQIGYVERVSADRSRSRDEGKRDSGYVKNKIQKWNMIVGPIFPYRRGGRV